MPVVPIHVGGTGNILRKGRTMPQPAEATVTFGAPMRPVGGERTPRFAARIEDAVTVLADEAATDWYSARKRAHASASGTLTGPEVGVWRRQWALRGRRRALSTHARRWPDL